MSETTAPAPPAHDLLLALAGWVDDDLLATGRELVAVGEEVPALELLVAALAAGRTALPEPVRASLVEAALALRVEPRADRALAPGAPAGDTTHRFSADAGPADVAVRVAEVASTLPVVARSGARVSLAWRVTPAGTAPGPLPHPVLLAAVGAGGPVEVLAYQLGASLARAGVLASVEAFAEGAELPPYHLAALDLALPLDPAAGADPGTVGPDPATAPGAGPPSGAATGPGADTTPDGAGSTHALAGAGRASGEPGRAVDAAVDAGQTRPDDLLSHGVVTGSALPGSRMSEPDAPTDRTPGRGLPADPSSPPGTAVPDMPAADVSSPGGAAPDVSDPDLVGSDVSTPARGTARPMSGTAGLTPGSAPPPAPGRVGPGRPSSGGYPSGSPSGPAPGAGPFDDGRAPDPVTDTPARRFPAAPARDEPRQGPRAVPDGAPGPAADEPAYAHPAPRPAARGIVPVPDDPEWFIDSSGSDGASTPLPRAAPPGDPHPAPSTGPIAVPRGDHAPQGREPAGGGSADPAEWDRDWATGAWSASEPVLEPATEPTPAADARDGIPPGLPSASGAPPILHAPVPPGRPTPIPRPHGQDADGSGPAASAQPTGPSGPRHRLDVPDPAGTSDTGDPADVPAVETTGPSGAVADEAPGAPTPEPSPDRFTEAQAQHPASQPPAGRTGPDPSGPGPRPAPHPARDAPRAPSRRPAPGPGPDLGGRLTPNEQDLLRRLQEELAARENGAPEPGPRNGSSHPDTGPAAG